MVVCQHCGRGRATRPRRLCWNCYYTPGVRELYPITSKFCRHGSGTGNRPAKPATCPTNALPGSLEKILVLTQRADLRQELWHPEDATWEGPRALSQVG